MITADPHDLAGAYAADALTGEERETFLRHVADCPDCATETALQQEAAAWLALAAARTPPPGLRERVLAEAARTPQLPPTLPAQADERRRRRSTPRLVHLALAASLAAAAALGGLAAWQHQEARQTRQEAASQAADFARLLAAPDTRFVKKDLSYGGTGTVAVSRQLNQAAYFCQELTPLPADKIYQLWYVAPGNKVRSAGLLRARSALQAVSLPPPNTAAALAITVEPSTGSAKPTTDPLTTWLLPTA
ncbi:anti-sigma factor [Streptomyces sp. AS02]|uniref:anti-sigma factor n=1 Tax=Streptomyces sp. AS02 TaxID=2938946 RepID=UPI0027E3DFE1|nr:anti-sigma factor [Streptomyces sp. AS02]